MSSYRRRTIQRLSIDPTSEFHQNLEEIATIEDENVFQLPLIFTERYNRDYLGYDHKTYHRSKFGFANSEKCGCHYDYDDSLIVNTDEYRRIHSLRTNEESCSIGMKEHECLYDLRKMEAFDLAIENAAQNGCTICYSVDEGLGFSCKMLKDR